MKNLKNIPVVAMCTVLLAACAQDVTVQKLRSAVWN